MRDHISPALAALHWLPVKRRVQFKTVTFVYKALNNLAPDYIVDLLDRPPSIRSLRSSDQLALRVPRSNSVRTGDRAFAVMGPKLWNKLPLDIKSAPTIETFKLICQTYI